jgi:catechol 2,3-dioxygenase-like lactoylglutathione lyase family enzyme
MVKATGVHHLAIATADIKSQLEFFSDVLGMELVALYDMHGVPDALHGFVKASDNCYLAFVSMPAINDVPIEIGKTHAGSGAGGCAPGTMQHVAFNVDSEKELLALRDRIRLKGVNVYGPINHGFCKSIYFAGPERLSLEIATSAKAIDARQWIDPAVVAKVGINPQELELLRRPASVETRNGAVPQPPMDPNKPHTVMPAERYQAILAMSDAEFSAMTNYPDPPVKLPAEAEA